jgi:hypothetical protein
VAGAVALVVVLAMAVGWLLLPSPSIADPSPAVTRSSPLVQHLAVPAYADPVAESASWTQLATSTPGSVGIVVANVANGPGSRPQADWSAMIHSTRLSGSRVLGYVDTGYLGSPSLANPNGLPTRAGALGRQAWLAQIESDIEAWYQFYGNDLGGVFLDEGTSACGPTSDPEQYASEYRAIRDHLRAAHPGSATVLNPGIAVPNCYRDAADVLVTFEGSYANYIAAPDHQGQDFEPLHWAPADPGQIWHIVYGATTTASMEHAMALSQKRGAGYVYITDAGLPNPFGSLPPGDYWASEVARLAR